MVSKSSLKGLRKFFRERSGQMNSNPLFHTTQKHKVISNMFYIHQLGDVEVTKHLINLRVTMFFKCTQNIIFMMTFLNF